MRPDKSFLEAQHPITKEWERAERVVMGDSITLRFPDGQVFSITEHDIDQRETSVTDVAKDVHEALEQRVRVVLVHIPTKDSASAVVKLKAVRAWAEHAVETYHKAHEGTDPADFLVIEIRGDVVKVTTLV